MNVSQSLEFRRLECRAILLGDLRLSNANLHTAQCFCGAVRLEVTGQPVAMGYCHCDSCRHWAAAPVNAFTLWKPDAVRITHGSDSVGTYNRSAKSYRKWCKKCGGHLYNQHPGWSVVDVYVALLPNVRFEAGLHVNYRETVLPLRDGKPKFADMPE